MELESNQLQERAQEDGVELEIPSLRFGQNTDIYHEPSPWLVLSGVMEGCGILGTSCGDELVLGYRLHDDDQVAGELHLRVGSNRHQLELWHSKHGGTVDEGVIWEQAEERVVLQRLHDMFDAKDADGTGQLDVGAITDILVEYAKLQGKENSPEEVRARANKTCEELEYSGTLSFAEYVKVFVRGEFGLGIASEVLEAVEALQLDFAEDNRSANQMLTDVYSNPFVGTWDCSSTPVKYLAPGMPPLTSLTLALAPGAWWRRVPACGLHPSSPDVLRMDGDWGAAMQSLTITAAHPMLQGVLRVEGV